MKHKQEILSRLEEALAAAEKSNCDSLRVEDNIKTVIGLIHDEEDS